MCPPRPTPESHSRREPSSRRSFRTARLLRRALQAIGALGVLIAIFVLAPGLGEVRDLLEEADPGWLVLATLLEGLSFASYVVMFGPIFCTGLSRRRSWQIGGSELAMGSLVPGQRRRWPRARAPGSSTAAAWTAARIARRSVAFFLIKSGVNFLAVAVIGAAMALGLSAPISRSG